MEKLFGTISWAGVNGLMNSREEEVLRDSFRLILKQEEVDQIRLKLGLLAPIHISLEDLQPPDSRLVTESLSYATESYPLPLLNHCWRTYFLGSLLALHAKHSFDRELAFSAAILHDIGLTKHASPGSTSCCFALSGARQSAAFLLDAGIDAASVEIIENAICLHANLLVPAEQHGSVAYIVAAGATCDVFGTGLSRISKANSSLLESSYPKTGIETAVNYEPKNYLAGTRGRTLFELLAANG